MINLLPDSVKESIRAARTNALLLKYIVFIGLAAVFLALACIASYMLLDNSKTVADNAVAGFISKNSSYSPISSRADKLKADLTTAKNILDDQVLFSTILTGIASCLPTGTVLESPLSININSIGTPMTLIAHSALATDEVSIKNNFSASPLFSNYKLNTVNNNPDSSTDYPIIITFSITINKAAVR